MQPEQIWQTALGQLQMEIPKSTFETWVRGTSLLTHEDGSYVVGVNNAYAKDWLENRLSGAVRRTLSGIVGRTVEVRFVVWPANGAGAPESAEAPADSPVEMALRARLDPADELYHHRRLDPQSKIQVRDVCRGAQQPAGPRRQPGRF